MMTEDPRSAAQQPIRSGQQNGRAVEAAGFEVDECVVRGVQRVRVTGDGQPVLGGEEQELPRVHTRVGRDAAQLPFLEQVALVVQRRYVGQVNAGDGER